MPKDDRHFKDLNLKFGLLPDLADYAKHFKDLNLKFGLQPDLAKQS
jgi:hypothetical protein